jgi:hypothetical protein
MANIHYLIGILTPTLDLVSAPLSLSAPETCAGRMPTQIGTPGNDTLRGTMGRDVIMALAGRDAIRGRGGRDRICGGRSRDDLHGGWGDDRLAGNFNNDDLHGDRGHDRVFCGRGRDSYYVGRGKDRTKNCELTLVRVDSASLRIDSQAIHPALSGLSRRLVQMLKKMSPNRRAGSASPYAVPDRVRPNAVSTMLAGSKSSTAGRSSTVPCS